MKEENQDVSITTYSDTWPRSAGSPRKRKKQGNATDVTKKDI